MSMSSMAGVGSYSASSNGDRLYPMTIQVQNTFGGYTPVSVLSDTGNEISIMKREVADMLGLDLNKGQSFNVGGINGQPRQFKKFRLNVKLGTLPPIPVTIGFAMNRGDLAENLLGNADILKSGKFRVVYDSDKVTYTQKAFTARVSSCDSYNDEQATLNNLYDQLTTRRRRDHKCHHDPEDMRDGGQTNSVTAYGYYW